MHLSAVLYDITVWWQTPRTRVGWLQKPSIAPCNKSWAMNRYYLMAKYGIEDRMLITQKMHKTVYTATTVYPNKEYSNEIYEIMKQS